MFLRPCTSNGSRLSIRFARQFWFLFPTKRGAGGAAVSVQWLPGALPGGNSITPRARMRQSFPLSWRCSMTRVIGACAAGVFALAICGWAIAEPQPDVPDVTPSVKPIPESEFKAPPTAFLTRVPGGASGSPFTGPFQVAIGDGKAILLEVNTGNTWILRGDDQDSWTPLRRQEEGNHAAAAPALPPE